MALRCCPAVFGVRLSGRADAGRCIRRRSEDLVVAMSGDTMIVALTRPVLYGTTRA